RRRLSLGTGLLGLLNAVGLACAYVTLSRRTEASKRRRFFCNKAFQRSRGVPRCRQGVARCYLNLHRSKAAVCGGIRRVSVTLDIDDTVDVVHGHQQLFSSMRTTTSAASCRSAPLSGTYELLSGFSFRTGLTCVVALGQPLPIASKAFYW